MILFFTSTLIVSVLGMVILLAVKRYELASGSLVLAGARPGISSFFQKTLRWVQQILPALARGYAERAWTFVLAQMHRAIAYGVVMFEHLLETVLTSVRSRTELSHPEHEPSAFLREVADHKKTLLYKKGLKKHTLKEPASRDSVQG